MNIDEVLERINDEIKKEYLEDKRVERVIKFCSALCAGIALQPIPIADFPILTTIEVAMVMKIGNIRGFQISRDRALDILKEILGVVGLGYLAKSGIIFAYKTFIPFLGGFFTIPLVYGACYAIGKVADFYFVQKRSGNPINKKELQVIYKRELEEGKRIGSELKNENKDK